MYNIIVISIRSATPEDAPAVLRLIQEMAAGSGGTSPLTIRFVEDYLVSPVSQILLAESGSRVVGLLSYSIRPDLYHAAGSCYIEELVVERSSRGQGVGGALLEAVLQRAAEFGCAEVSLSVMPDNEPAIRLYRQHGLVEEALFLEKHL